MVVIGLRTILSHIRNEESITDGYCTVIIILAQCGAELFLELLPTRNIRCETHHNSLEDLIGDGGQHTVLIILAKCGVNVGQSCGQGAKQQTERDVDCLQIWNSKSGQWCLDNHSAG